MIKIGNAVICEENVVEAHVNSEKNYLKVSFVGGAQTIFNRKVLKMDADEALDVLMDAIADSYVEETPVEEPAKEKMDFKDLMMMNAFQNMMNQQNQNKQ